MLKKNRKSQFVILRVTEQEKGYLERQAKKHKVGGKISTFIRHVLGLTKDENNSADILYIPAQNEEG